jgi:hypothetical protein
MIGIRRWLVCTALALGSICSAAPSLTTIQDVLYKADGAPFNGFAIISWPSFIAGDSSNIAQETLRLPIVNGYLYVQLVPTTNATPAVTYSVQYNSDGRVAFTETWAVPPSASPLQLQDVRVTGVVVSPPLVTPVSLPISGVVGLQNELNLRPTAGIGYSASRAAVIDSNGAIDGAVGNLSDCIHVDGTSGPCGTSGASAGFVDGEIPSGTANGTNTAFSLSNAPSPAASLKLSRNGLLLSQGSDYSLSGSAITFLSPAAPQTGDTIQASYRLNVSIASVAFADGEVPGGSINGSNLAFTLVNSPNPAASLALYRNGVLERATLDYTLSGSTVTFATASTPQTGDTLACFYRH